MFESHGGYAGLLTKRSSSSRACEAAAAGSSKMSPDQQFAPPFGGAKRVVAACLQHDHPVSDKNRMPAKGQARIG
jgi:hypothetical protein